MAEPRSTSSSRLPPLTPMLLLAEKWAHHRQDGTSRGGASFGNGKVEPMIQVLHGAVPIYVRDLGKCLMVIGVLDLPAEVSTLLAAATVGERSRFLVGLEEILMSCPRIGYAVDPKGTVDAAALRRVVLDQTIQIAEDDAASFNRYCDAIQETETLLLRAGAFVSGFLPAAPSTPRYSSGSPPPSELYL